MSLSFVVDMNLSPEWVPILEAEGWPSVHWRTVGLAWAGDGQIMEWARTHHRTVLSQDLDFGTLLALTNADSPSVVLLRGGDVLPDTRGPDVVAAIRAHQVALMENAIVVVEIERSRVRALPLNSQRPNR